MNMRWILGIPAILLLILDLVGILLLVVPNKQMEMPSDNMFGIVLDAGSSHTSMYIYKWPADKQNGTGIVTQHEECDVEGPGISSYAGKEGGAATSLETCLEKAMTVIPESRHRQTPLCLGATAGMRLLNIENATESERVLKEVEKKLRSYPFLFKEATILSGQAEGAYGWITVNYLLENFVKYGFVGRWINPGRDTIGALDLGGASTQITFQTSEKVEDKSNEMVLKLYGQTYTLYTQSFLCYGQDQFLRKLLAQLIQVQGLGKKEISNPCYPRGFNTSIVLGKDVFDSPCTKENRPAQFDREMKVAVKGTGDYLNCYENVQKLFSFTNCPFSKCSFNKVFQPSVTGNFMAFSAFYFTQKYISQLTNISMTSPIQTEKAIQRVCNMTITELVDVTKMTEKFMKNVCAVSNFVQILLIQGYHFESSLPSIAFRQKAGDASVGWALGYMLNVTNAVPAESLGVMKALPFGAWSGVLAIFIVIMILSVAYLVITYGCTKR